MATLYERFNTGNDGYGAIYGDNWGVQTFTPQLSHIITSVKLFLYRINSPGTLTVSIRETDGDGKPTGSDLCSGTTDASTLPTGSPYEWREITLGTTTYLSANVKYSIVIRTPFVDIYTAVAWRKNEAGGYTNGQGGGSSDAGVTWTLVTPDFLFEDWGEARTYALSCSDGLKLGDSNKGSLTLTLLVTDGIVLSDLETIGKFYLLLASDGLKIGDSTAMATYLSYRKLKDTTVRILGTFVGRTQSSPAQRDLKDFTGRNLSDVSGRNLQE